MTLSEINETVAVQPTLVIGLGETGIRLLELLQRRMPVGFDSEVSCLGLRVAKWPMLNYSQTKPMIGTLGDVINIPWNPEETRRLVDNHLGFEWYNSEDNDPQAEMRRNGRMAFLTAVHFNHDHRLENRLKALIGRHNISESNQLIVFVIASLREVESAFLGDLISSVFTQLGLERIRLLLPCLMLDDIRGNAPLRPGWVAAGLREIERFMLQGRQLVLGLPNTLLPVEQPILEGGLFHQLLLFNNEVGLEPLANQLVALFERDAAWKFAEDFCNLPVPERFSIATSISHTFWVPVEDLRMACAARFLKEELLHFDNYTGVSLTLIVTFLRGEAKSVPVGWEAFLWMADVLEQKSCGVGRLMVNANQLPELFGRQLAEFLKLHFPTSLYGAERFLENLRSEMERSMNAISRIRPDGQLVANQMPAFRLTIGCFLESIAGWKTVLSILEGLCTQRYEEIRKSLRQALSSSLNAQTLFLHGAAKDDPIEPAYADFRAQPPEIWDDVTTKLHAILLWDWVSNGGDQSYVRCLIQDIAHTEPELIFNPLLTQAYQLTGTVASSVNIFHYLGRLSAQKFNSTLEQAPSLLACDPFSSPDVRIKQYLVSANDRMLDNWNLSPDITRCEAQDWHRMTYLRLLYNQPVQAVRSYLEDLDVYLSSRVDLHVYHHEKNAQAAERMLQTNGQGEKGIPAAFTRIMHDECLFMIAMWCVYFDWIRRISNSRAKMQWYLETPGNVPFSLETDDIPAISMEDALVNFVLTIPSRDLSGYHPLNVSNLPFTLERLEEAINQRRNMSYEDRKIDFTSVKNRIEKWRNHNNPFLNGLATFQSLLLKKEKNRRAKLESNSKSYLL